MDKIHVGRAGTKLGEFSIEEIQAGLAEGRFLATDLGWRAGMPQWQPLASFPELHETLATAASVPPMDSLLATSTPEIGPSWERRSELGFFRAITGTIKEVLTAPNQTFAQMKRTGGLTDPLAFYMILAVISGMFGVFYSALFPSSLLDSGDTLGLHSAPATPMSIATGLLILPFFVLLGAFIGAGIAHVCLMIVGAANRGFETTFRVLCYAYGSTTIFMIVPACGGLIAGIWGLVAAIIGIKQAQETDTWRAAVGLLLPVALCCGIVALLIGVIAAFASQAGGLRP